MRRASSVERRASRVPNSKDKGRRVSGVERQASVAEAFAIYRYLVNSLSVSLPKPSLILEKKTVRHSGVHQVPGSRFRVQGLKSRRINFSNSQERDCTG